MFMVDRNFTFMKYDMSKFSMKNLTRIFSIPLNKTILNQSCSDLTYLTELKIILLFCKSRNASTGESFRTIVKMKNFLNSTKPEIKYLSYKSSEDHPDMSLGLRYLGL